MLISNDTGVATDYALWGLEERGYLIISGGVKVYQGMIIGQHNRENDLEVNALKAKQLTNIRTTSKDEAVRLTPARVPTLEQAIAYIEEDELMEVTPKNIRLRKRATLTPTCASAWKRPKRTSRSIAIVMLNLIQHPSNIFVPGMMDPESSSG